MVLDFILIVVFILGYAAIAFEPLIKINKATSALLMGIVAWVIVFFFPTEHPGHYHHLFGEQLSEIAQIILFLLSTLAIVEVVNTHGGFSFISSRLQMASKKKMLLSIGGLTFFLSAILGSITTSIVMVALLGRMIADKNDRWLLGSGVVLAANAGGVWSPIGDITTTMLWIGGQLSTLEMVADLFLPSLTCVVVSVFCLSFFLKGSFKSVSKPSLQKEPHTQLIFWLGVALLIAVPVFKVATGLPAFMGSLLGLSILWLVTDRLHGEYENRDHLRVPYVMSKVDLSGAIFFLGALLAVNAMGSAGVLNQLAMFLTSTLGKMEWIATAVGFVSAIIDNIPLVAAMMGMFSLEEFPQDHYFWQMIAYCAGVGGSILIVGSAPGVAFMGMEKVSFLWYLKRVSLPALLGYLAGLFIYQLG